MNRVQHAHIRNPQRCSFKQAAAARAVLAPFGHGTSQADGIYGSHVPMARDGKRTGLAGLQGYTQHKFIGVEDNQ